MGKAFAMRLMQMGLTVYVVGETVTPGISSADFLLLCSGSGETGGLVAMARKANQAGAPVGLITIKPDSTIAQLAQVVVRLPASAKRMRREPERMLPFSLWVPCLNNPCCSAWMR